MNSTRILASCGLAAGCIGLIGGAIGSRFPWVTGAVFAICNAIMLCGNAYVTFRKESPVDSPAKELLRARKILATVLSQLSDDQDEQVLADMILDFFRALDQRLHQRLVGKEK